MRKINLFDAFILLLVILLGIFLFSAYTKEQKALGRPVILTIEVTSDVESISQEVKVGENVYLNSVNSPVAIAGTERELECDEETATLEIKVQAEGEITDDYILFNGQRVLVGQKAELHGKFFAQGVIEDAQYNESN